MEALTVKEYRNSLGASFNRADHGERVLIRRKNEIYALIKVGREDLMTTPELQERIQEAELDTKAEKAISKWKKSNPLLFKKLRKYLARNFHAVRHRVLWTYVQRVYARTA